MQFHLQLTAKKAWALEYVVSAFYFDTPQRETPFPVQTTSRNRHDNVKPHHHDLHDLRRNYNNQGSEKTADLLRHPLPTTYDRSTLTPDKTNRTANSHAFHDTRQKRKANHAPTLRSPSNTVRHNTDTRPPTQPQPLPITRAPRQTQTRPLLPPETTYKPPAHDALTTRQRPLAPRPATWTRGC